MSEKTVNIYDAKTQLSRLISRVEQGAGEPVAELRPARKSSKRCSPLHDPLFRVDKYSYDGPIGRTTNKDIDSTVYGM